AFRRAQARNQKRPKCATTMGGRDPIRRSSRTSPNFLRTRSSMFATLITLALCTASPSTQAPAHVAQSEFSVAINIAGRQRMYSQKMTKEFLFAALGIDAAQNKKNAAATVALFEDNQKLLLAGDAERGLPAPPTDDIKKQLQDVGAQWSALRA